MFHTVLPRNPGSRSKNRRNHHYHTSFAQNRRILSWLTVRKHRHFVCETVRDRCFVWVRLKKRLVRCLVCETGRMLAAVIFHYCLTNRTYRQKRDHILDVTTKSFLSRKGDNIQLQFIKKNAVCQSCRKKIQLWDTLLLLPVFHIFYKPPTELSDKKSTIY